jgi:hypothetical protein
MQWLDRARSILNGTHGLSLPDPDRIDVGSIPDTAALIRAIDAAMPRTAILQLIDPHHPAVLAFLAKHSIARRRSTGEYFVSLEDGATTELARLAARCPPDEVCAHLFVQDGEHTLLEAFGRDRGEDVVWVDRRLPRSTLRRFLEVALDAGEARRAKADRPAVYRINDAAHPTKEDDMLRIPRRALFMVAAVALSALTLTACVQRPPLVVEMSTGDIIRLESWTATLSSATDLGGMARLTPATYRETLATISVSGAAPNATHAWYVQLGECGRDLGILAGPQAYVPLVADQRGDGRSTVTLPFTVPMNGRYFVTVRAADTERSAVVACGNLTRDPIEGGPTVAEGRAR